jgi:hypothetical protein
MKIEYWVRCKTQVEIYEKRPAYKMFYRSKKMHRKQ